MRRIKVLTILLVIGAACGLLLWALTRSKPALTQVLPDGTVVTVNKISYGKSFSYPAEIGWRKIAGQILPQKWATGLGIRVQTYTNTADTIWVLVSSHRDKGGFEFPTKPPPMPYSFGTTASIHDEVADEFPMSEAAAYSRKSSGGDNLFDLLKAPLVPHSSREVTLELYQQDWARHTNYQARFTIPNPARHFVPKWTAQTPPLTNNAGDLTVELVSLVSRRTAPTPNSNPPGPRLLAHLRTFRNGSPANDWKIAGVTVFDEEGNAYTPYAAGYPAPDKISFEGGLSDADARKFRFTLSRIFPSSTESATLKKIRVPDDDSSISPPLDLDLHGFTLHLDRLTEKNNFQQISLQYHITPDPPPEFHHHVIIKYLTRDGEEAVLYDQDGGSSSGGNAGIGRSQSAIVKSNLVNVTFTLTPVEHRSVDFITRPSPAPTNSTPFR